mmetsp:Transcript_45467/g.105440  ORF Transcript_45467/g.105440 Transcript_45467/m.105440 type:complete len:234 (-) Transcript_45467:6-707(-)
MAVLVPMANIAAPESFHGPGSSLPSEMPRKRQGTQVPSYSSAPRGSSLASVDDTVAALLPKMKRMRLRPSLGQLRLQREVDEVSALPPEVQLLLEPEQLRATVTIGALPSSLAPWQDASPRDAVMHLEVSFPPQYPHKPPKVMQVAPESFLPCWRYEAGRVVALARLTEYSWSCSMGVLDIIKDLIQAVHEAHDCESQPFGGRRLLNASCRDEAQQLPGRMSYTDAPLDVDMD